LNSFTWSLSVQALVAIVILASGVLAQVYRYHRLMGRIERQQTRWVVFGISITLLLYIVGSLVYLQFNTGSPTAKLVSNFIMAPVFALALLLVPITITISILRFRLWEIDRLINRALVYGLLSAFVVGVYVLIVGFLGQLLHPRGELHQPFDFALSLLATAGIAVLFQPVRERLQRFVNHVLYGLGRDDPYAVLSRLGQRLEATLAPEAVLPTLVEAIAQALRLPYVAIALQRANGSEPEIAAAYGLPVGAAVRLPLTYQAGHVGELLIAPRAPDETFTPAEQRLLTDIAHQAGVAAHAVRLTADLQRSRERLVTAREEERRRLRRDLHDGLGPALALHSLKVGSARSLLSRSLPALSGLGSAEQDIAAADAVLAALERDIAGALADIRRLVYDLRPPTLDELGLVAAIRESAARYAPTAAPNANALRITVDAPEPFPLLPAAVEVAAFRISQEALTNVVRHAQARTCHIGLKLDDGVGLSAARTEHPAGVGLASMRERAEELGGTCVIESPPTGGTRVRAYLPLG
jgi:signal transduction histidine kinase